MTTSEPTGRRRETIATSTVPIIAESPRIPRRCSFNCLISKTKILDIGDHITKCLTSEEGQSSIKSFVMSRTGEIYNQLKRELDFIRDVERFRENDVSFSWEYFVVIIYERYIENNALKEIRLFSDDFKVAVGIIATRIKAFYKQSDEFNRAGGNAVYGIQSNYFDGARKIVLDHAKQALLDNGFIASPEHKSYLKSKRLKL